MVNPYGTSRDESPDPQSGYGSNAGGNGGSGDYWAPLHGQPGGGDGQEVPSSLGPPGWEAPGTAVPEGRRGGSPVTTAFIVLGAVVLLVIVGAVGSFLFGGRVTADPESSPEPAAPATSSSTEPSTFSLSPTPSSSSRTTETTIDPEEEEGGRFWFMEETGWSLCQESDPEIWVTDEGTPCDMAIEVAEQLPATVSDDFLQSEVTDPATGETVTWDCVHGSDEGEPHWACFGNTDEMAFEYSFLAFP